MRRRLAAAWWALRALRAARRGLPRSRVGAVRLPTPPATGGRDVGAVCLVLRLGRASCLERALVLQRWLAARQDLRAVVIGVASPRAGFEAHAWLDGEPSRGFHEVARLEL
jgi:hypothetical protein